MNPDKRIIIDDLTARVNASPFLIVVDYTSITVPEFTNLRSALAACGAQCHVAKNNFMRTALTDAGLPDIGEHLVGQTADQSAVALHCSSNGKHLQRFYGLRRPQFPAERPRNEFPASGRRPAVKINKKSRLCVGFHSFLTGN